MSKETADPVAHLTKEVASLGTRIERFERIFDAHQHDWSVTKGTCTVCGAEKGLS